MTEMPLSTRVSILALDASLAGPSGSQMKSNYWRFMYFILHVYFMTVTVIASVSLCWNITRCIVNISLRHLTEETFQIHVTNDCDNTIHRIKIMSNY